MTVDQLIADIEGRGAREEVVTDDVIEEPELMFNLAIIVLQEVGKLLDRLSDKRDRRISKHEMMEIAKAADEVYEFLQQTDVEPDEFATLRERE